MPGVGDRRGTGLALVVERQGAMPAEMEVRLPVGFTGVVGRNPGAVVVLRDPDVSRAHAALMVDVDGTWIADLSSSNGTFVNDALVADWTPVRAGDVIGFGPIRASVRPAPDRGRAPTVFLFSLIIVVGLVFLSLGVSISS